MQARVQPGGESSADGMALDGSVLDVVVLDAVIVRVLRDGDSCSIVARLQKSNTVVKCVVDLRRSQRNVRVHHLHEGRQVTLNVLSCDPPEIVVGVRVALSKEEEEAVGAENFARFQCCWQASVDGTYAAALPELRKRPFLSSLDHV